MTVDPYAPPKSDFEAPAAPDLAPVRAEWTAQLLTTRERWASALRNRYTWYWTAFGGVGLVGAAKLPVFLVLTAISAYKLVIFLRTALSAKAGPSGARVDAGVVIDGEGLRSWAGDATRELSWRDAARWAETETMLCVFPRRGIGLALERKHLRAEEQAQIRAWLEAQLPTASEPASKPRTARTVLLWLALVAVFFAIYKLLTHGQ